MTNIYNENLERIVTLNYKLEDFKQEPEKFYPDWKVTYYATETQFLHPTVENGTLREMTRLEKVKAGIENLADGEKIIVINPEIGEAYEKIEYVSKPEGLKVEWINFEWVETATEEELATEEFRVAREFYNEELEFASKATAELMCEIISADEYAGVKEYMQAIDPYAQTMRVARLSAPVRPSIFDKYN